MFNTVMHIAFYTDKMDEMLDFYINKLGLKQKTLVKYDIYIDRDDRPEFQAIAKKDPERVFNTYIEIAPGQFIELFPATEEMLAHVEWNKNVGYSHFALTVDDIYQTRKELEERGVKFVSSISKGPSETYKMWTHDPDGNMFEIMQYTEKSIQVIGNL